MSYQTPRNTRREARTLVGQFRGGKLQPVLATPVRGNEGGMLSQSITLELAPIAGRMITPIFGEFISVYVPVQAIDAIKDPEAAYAGMTEVLREKLLSGNPLFGLEEEGQISMACGVNPRCFGEARRVNECVRLAHNAAVNHLRRRKYWNADLIEGDNTMITPAIRTATVLDLLNGVLDPDDHINGSVQLDIADMKLPVSGIGFPNNTVPEGGDVGVYETDGMADYERARAFDHTVPDRQVRARVQLDPDAGTVGAPDIYAKLNGVVAGGVSLTDFYNAEKMDRLTRTMREIVDSNPDYGEEMVLRWAHGLSVDTGKTPFVLHEQRQTFGRAIVNATDTSGVEDDVMRSDMMLQMRFAVPVPRTELGGIIITFACLKPDETLVSQPHPILSDVWGADNFVADELALDPVPVTVRDVYSECIDDNDNDVVFYTGLNALKQTYVNYGLCRLLDPENIENKTAIWQLPIPASVLPDNVIYPSELDHYPFADQMADVCTYTITSNAVIQTPMIFGPTPVEELAVIGETDLFEQEE